MRNIIEKLLRIDENSMSGGEISYSWTTWCIVIQLLREKVNYKYGGIVIYKSSIRHTQQDLSGTLNFENINNTGSTYQYST